MHGGAWKIAYADFVTAMMAFFLLMWLLGSTTEGDKKGIADYFASPLKIAMSGGSGSGDSNSVLRGGGDDLTPHRPSARSQKRGEVEAQRNTINLHKLKAEQTRAEIARLEALKQQIQDKLDASAKLRELSSQIRLDMTRDGLRIQIVDEHNRPMFDSGSAVVKPYMRDLLQAIGSVLTEVPNRLTLEGHTDAQPYSGGENAATATGSSRPIARTPRAASCSRAAWPTIACCACRAWPRASPSTTPTRWRRPTGASASS